MIQQKYSIHIDAPAEKVWKVLWDDTTYRQWTAVFAEGSYAKTDWEEGSKAYFLTADGSGMVSTIKQNLPPQIMSIEHLGIVDNNVEDYESEHARQWAGAIEAYRLEPHNGNTRLNVQMGIVETYTSYFEETWPKALEKIKALAEK